MYPDMSPPPAPPETKPLTPREPVTRPVDPLAAVAGNATAFGLGYLLLSRPRLAAIALTGTAFLLYALALDPENLPWRILFGLWWIAMTLHAWHLTRGADAALLDPDEPGRVPRVRLLALGAAAIALLMVAGLRLDAWLTVRGAAAAQTEGDCAAAAQTLESLEAAHRIASGAVAADGEEQLEACRILLQALSEEPQAGANTMIDYMDHPGALWEGAGPERADLLLATARSGESDIESALEAAFAQLSTTLETTPGQSGRVRDVVEDLFTDLAADRLACKVMQINTWIYAQQWDAPELAEPIAAAAAQVPVRMVDCARLRSEAAELEDARDAYTAFLAAYPDHALAAAATDELYAVETAIEYDNVDGLLSGGEYCDSPAPYRAAPAYEGEGPHAMWTFGLDPAEYGFPGSWQAGSVNETVLVTCVEGPEQGKHLETCTYAWEDPSPIPYSSVSFHASRFEIKVYELRTGAEVASYTEEIGTPCPNEMTYYGAFPPNEALADFSDKEVREMFYRLMD